MFIHSRAQDLVYQNFSTHNGLTSSQVYDFFQDKNGLMWFATDRGLVNYDGNEFTSFGIEDGVPSSTVFKFFPQADGRIWCSTIENRWFWFKNGTEIFELYKYNDSVVYYSNGALYEDMHIAENGTMYFSFEDHYGVLSIDSKGIVNSTLQSFSENGFKRYYVQEKTGENESFSYLWKEEILLTPVVSTSTEKVLLDEGYFGFKKAHLNNSTYYFSIGNDLYIQQKNEQRVIHFNSKILGIGTFKNDLIWVGTNKLGMFVIDSSGRIIQRYLDGKSITSFRHDHANGMWFSTLSQGVFYAQSKIIRQYPLLSENVYMVNPGKDGPLIGTMDGSVFQIVHNKMIDVPVSNSKENLLRGVYSEIYGGNVLTGSEDEDLFIQFPDRRHPCRRGVSKFSESTRRPLLIAGFWGVMMFKGKEEIYIPFDHIKIRSVDWGEEGIYVGTIRGLYFVDPSTKKLEKLFAQELDVRIEDVKSYGSSVFVGTMGYGAGIIRNGKVKMVTEKKGLSSNWVNNVFPRNDSTLWVATSNGLNLVSFSQHGNSIRIFNQNNGLPDNDVTDIVEQDGKLWIGTRKGLCSVDIGELERNAEVSSNLFIRVKKVIVNGIETTIHHKVLSSDQNNIQIDIGAVNFSAGQNISFRYKLMANDSWKYIQERSIQLFDLPSGQYEVVIQVSLDQDSWDANEITVPFTIAPPFYKTIWFILLVIGLSIYIIYLFFKFRVLLYNRDLVRELLRVLVKKLKPKTDVFVVKEQGMDCRISSADVLYVKAQGNYLEVYTSVKRYVIREKIGEFLSLVPDKLEYMRVNRSFIVRMDKITAHSTTMLHINEVEIPIGRTYQKDVSAILGE